MPAIPDSRRSFFKHSAIGAIAMTTPLGLIDCHPSWNPSSYGNDGEIPLLYPAIDYNRIKETVGASHMNFARVKELVSEQPELANAVWDWGFGDMESAIGAASHMGQAATAEFLIKHGARPNIFTYAMLGSLDSVKNMVEATPGVQRNTGPHGITLLTHAKNRLRWDLTSSQKQSVMSVVKYLEALGDADISDTGIPYSEEDVSRYFGTYKYGNKAEEIFVVEMNDRKILSIAKKGDFGRSLRKHGDNFFHVQGCPSGRVRFNVEDDEVISVSILAPMREVSAPKI